jgi:hypothetical protein
MLSKVKLMTSDLSAIKNVLVWSPFVPESSNSIIKPNEVLILQN